MGRHPAARPRANQQLQRGKSRAAAPSASSRPKAPTRRRFYGGAIAGDSSGTPCATSRSATPASRSQPNAELQGLTTGGVGSGTTIQFIHVHNSGDDGIEIFGGTHNMKNLVITGADDDTLDTDFGYKGLIQFLIGIPAPAVGQANTGDAMIEADSPAEVAGAADFTPRQNTRLANFTFVQTARAARRSTCAAAPTYALLNGVVSGRLLPRRRQCRNGADHRTGRGRPADHPFGRLRPKSSPSCPPRTSPAPAKATSPARCSASPASASSAAGFVYVRGLGERYSLALLNGSPLPSPEPLRRVVPLDIFPTSVIASSVVQKSYSVNYPGEFGGGVINLTTRSAPEEPFLTIGASIGGDTETTGQLGYTYYGSDTDLDRLRRRHPRHPGPLQARDRQRQADRHRPQFQRRQLKDITASLSQRPTTLIQRFDEHPANLGFSLSGGTTFDNGGSAARRPLRRLATATAGRPAAASSRSRPASRRQRRGHAQPRRRLPLPLDREPHPGERPPLGFGLEFGEHQLRWTNLYIRDTSRKRGSRTAPTRSTSAPTSSTSATPPGSSAS
jgi:hypothetical protein